MAPYRTVCLGVACAVVALGTSPAKAEITARDIRTETRTHWDYQPGQGPMRPARDRSFFTPSGKRGTEVVPPTPPVEPGDYRNPPRAEDRVPKPMPSNEPKTETSIDVGLQVSAYDYNEDSLGVKIYGPNFGLAGSGTFAWDNNWFVRGDLRLAYGVFDYKGSGSQPGVDNFIAEARALGGYDLLRGRYGLSPYTGLGFRYLLNDLRGQTTTGASGYLRHSQYFYLPVGVQPRMTLLNGARLSLTGEFDWLLHGWQTSELSNASSAFPDINNHQHHGYGLRGNLMYEDGRWSFGPFVQYWNIGTSDTACKTGESVIVCGVEPRNTTLESGIQFRYRLY